MLFCRHPGPIDLVPGLGTDPALVGLIPVLIDQLGLQDVEDLLRVHIAARRTLTGLGRHLTGDLLEIDHRLHGIAVVDRMALLVHEQEPVEHLEDVGGRLMDHHEDEPALERQFPEQVHDVLRIPAR